MTFSRPCKKCGDIFKPESKHSKVCEKCKNEGFEKKRNTTRTYQIQAYKVQRLTKQNIFDLDFD